MFHSSFSIKKRPCLRTYDTRCHLSSYRNDMPFHAITPPTVPVLQILLQSVPVLRMQEFSASFPLCAMHPVFLFFIESRYSIIKNSVLGKYLSRKSHGFSCFHKGTSYKTTRSTLLTELTLLRFAISVRRCCASFTTTVILVVAVTPSSLTLLST